MWETNLKFQKIIKRKWEKINYHPTWQALFMERGGTQVPPLFFQNNGTQSHLVGAARTRYLAKGITKQYLLLLLLLKPQTSSRNSPVITQHPKSNFLSTPNCPVFTFNILKTLQVYY
jgi:hypothetical protein